MGHVHSWTATAVAIAASGIALVLPCYADVDVKPDQRMQMLMKQNEEEIASLAKDTQKVADLLDSGREAKQPRSTDTAKIRATLNRSSKAYGLGCVMVIKPSSNIVAVNSGSSARCARLQPSPRDFKMATQENRVIIEIDRSASLTYGLARLNSVEGAYVAVARDADLNRLEALELLTKSLRDKKDMN